LTDADLQSNWDEATETFDGMELPEELLRGIYSYGFEKPSAIQQRAIKPTMMGRDLIAQAQSGTVSRHAHTYKPPVVRSSRTRGQNGRGEDDFSDTSSFESEKSRPRRVGNVPLENRPYRCLDILWLKIIFVKESPYHAHHFFLLFTVCRVRLPPLPLVVWPRWTLNFKIVKH
jgi:hypothetical protein